MLNTVGRVILLIAIFAAVGFFSNEICARVRLIRLGGRDENRWDKPLERLGFVVSRVMSQLCSIKDRPFVGLMHAFVFWGFVFFTVATINHVGGAFSPGFSLWGHGTFNSLWFLGVDIVSMLTIMGTLYLAWRRYLIKPEPITKPMPISKSPQSAIVLSLIFGLMVTYLLNQGAEVVLSGHTFAQWMPFSKMTGSLLGGASETALRFWNTVFWWSHILMVLAFLVFIPHSKHLHLLAGPFNIFFRSRRPIGHLQKLDFEVTEEFGVSNVTQYQWKSILDFFSCVDCGRCQDQCPAYLSQKPLSPKVVMMSLRKHILNERKNLLAGNEPSEPIMDKWQTADEIWACTTCGACMETCPVMNEHIPTIVDLRRAQVMMESKFPQELNLAFRGLENNGNPWNMGHSARADWIEGMEIPLVANNPEVDYLWFVGCAGSFDDKAKAVSKAFVQILNKAGVSYAVLGIDEKCCGDPARRSGNEYVFQMLAEENIAAFNACTFKKILTACPHCYNVIRNEYPQFSGNYEVIHHSELIADLLQTGQLQLNEKASGTLAYHDSCYLGRYHEIYDAPREILHNMSNDNLTELNRKRDKSFCCGGGGARMFMEETLGERINHLRIDEAAQAGINTLSVACPFCLTMLQDAVNEKSLTDAIHVKDLAQMVAERI